VVEDWTGVKGEYQKKKKFPSREYCENARAPAGELRRGEDLTAKGEKLSVSYHWKHPIGKGKDILRMKNYHHFHFGGIKKGGPRQGRLVVG